MGGGRKRGAVEGEDRTGWRGYLEKVSANAGFPARCLPPASRATDRLLRFHTSLGLGSAELFQANAEHSVRTAVVLMNGRLRSIHLLRL